MIANLAPVIFNSSDISLDLCLFRFQETSTTSIVGALHRRYTPVGYCCEINSENILLYNWKEIFQESDSQTILACNPFYKFDLERL